MEAPFKDVFVLLLYLLPGFLSLQLKRAKYPAKKLSDIETIIWSVAHTFFIHVILAGLSALLSDPRLNFLAKKSSEIGPAEVFTLMAVGFLWGSLLIFWHWSQRKLPIFGEPDPLNIWFKIADLAAREEKWAVVRVKEGPVYLGWIKDFSYDPAQENQDFFLSPAHLVDNNLTSLRNLEEGGVYLNTRDVISIELLPGRAP